MITQKQFTINKSVSERVLTFYFTLENILAKFDAINIEIMATIASYFGISDSEKVKELFLLTQSSFLEGINTSKKAFRLEREIETCNKMGIECDLSDMDCFALLCKSNALRIMEKSGLLFSYDLNGCEMLCLIEKSAQDGELTALSAFGFLLANGVGVSKNLILAKKMLGMGEKWGDLNCCLMLLYYDNQRANIHLSFFESLCSEYVHKELYNAIKKAHGNLSVPPNDGVNLISLCLKQNKDIKNDNYNERIAKIAYSSKLSLFDKEKILTGGLDKINLACELPLEDVNPTAALCYENFVQMPLKREREAETIWKKLALNDLNNQKYFVPLLLICEDRFVLDMYKEKIAATLGFELINETDASSITFGLLENNKNNILIRLLTESPMEKAMLVFDNMDNLGDEADRFGKLIRVKNRKSFVLNDVGVSLNLSKAVIILTATKPPHQSIQGSCETIYLDAIKENEKPLILDAIIDKHNAKSEFSKINLSKHQRDIICKASSGLLRKIVKEIIILHHACCLKGEKRMPSDEDIKKIVSEYSDSVKNFGFVRMTKTTLTSPQQAKEESL